MLVNNPTTTGCFKHPVVVVVSMRFKEFETNGIYHIFNRGVDKRKIFYNNQDYTRFILALYILNDSKNKYDIWSSLKFEKHKTLNILKSATTGMSGLPLAIRKQPLVEILCFAQMPNHYHLLVRQIQENGVSKFMQKIGAGYVRYFNEQNDRKGSLFEGSYKAVPIKTDRQLINIFNYIHTNPVELVEPEWKDFKVKNKKNAIDYLKNYKWSSYRDYINIPTFPVITERSFFLDLLGGEEECKKHVIDWISFKAENVELDNMV